ncbi:MAG: photosynthetic reaction center subunit H [Minwuia sp.]|uniref:photosynthetic reaction center subunit H n=1 Tax=Minwuia sp. TaxID=2493630 RepID=UPI003A8BADC1
MVGAITNHIDVAQIVLYAFFIFFIGLVVYLRREDRREGYPLVSEVAGQSSVTEGLIQSTAAPKEFRLHDGTSTFAPHDETDDREIMAEPVAGHTGAPLVPTGDPMADGVGPAAYSMRRDVPDVTLHGDPKITPLRAVPDFSIDEESPDPRGMSVIGCDGAQAGTVSDVWIDRTEFLVRYLEVTTAGDEGRSVLLPMPLAVVSAGSGQVKVDSVTAEQFGRAPGTQNPDQVTFLEEDRISAYFASGHLYATPARQEPLL